MDIEFEKIKSIAYKDNLSVSESKILLQAWARCAIDFRFFLGFGKIVVPPTRKDPGGIVPLEMWPHILEIVDAFENDRLISLMKSRQIGASWIVAFWCLWNALFHNGDVSMLFSKGEIEAIELLGKAKLGYRQLPPFMRLKMNPDSATEIGFPAMMSSIKAMAATESAGISFTASRIVTDEHEQHPYAEQNYVSAKPTIDAGGQFISIFTVDKLKPETLAKTIFRGSDLGDNINGFKGLFFPYWVRPGRDENWYEETKKSIPFLELKALTPELYMEQCYPRSIDEALSTPQTSLAFDRKVLNEMMDDVRNPINKEPWDEIDSDICHIYKDYHIGNFYIAGTDVSLGVGKDFNVTVIMEVKTGDIVADILSQYLAPEQLAFHSVELLKRYHSPLWWIEQNLWGRTVIKKALELGYRRLGYKGDTKPSFPYTDDDITKFGFTTEEKSRGDLFGLLIPAINDYQIRIYNQQGLGQFYGIIRNAAKNGRIEAMSSKHDDYPVAVGICWLKKGDVKTTAFVSKPVETLSFIKTSSFEDRIRSLIGG